MPVWMKGLNMNAHQQPTDELKKWSFRKQLQSISQAAYGTVAAACPINASNAPQHPTQATWRKVTIGIGAT